MRQGAALAERHALPFGLLITVLFTAVVIVAGIVRFPIEGEAASALVSAGVMLAGAILFTRMLHGLGWLEDAGLSEFGTAKAWTLLTPIIV